jgi:Protein of unknown function (DUF3592)
MGTWQSVLLGLACLIVAATFVATGIMRDRRTAAMKAWPTATGTVKEAKGVPLSPRGQGAAVLGEYVVDGVVHSFKLIWGPYEFVGGVLGVGGTYVAPADTPAVGDTVTFRYDPKDPRSCARADRDEGTSFGIVQVALILVFVLGAALIFWTLAMGYR